LTFRRLWGIFPDGNLAGCPHDIAAVPGSSRGGAQNVACGEVGATDSTGPVSSSRRRDCTTQQPSRPSTCSRRDPDPGAPGPSSSCGRLTTATGPKLIRFSASRTAGLPSSIQISPHRVTATRVSPAWPVSTRVNSPRNDDPNLLEPVRDFAGERLTPEEKDRLLRAHAEYYCHLAEGAEGELEGPKQVQALDRLDASEQEPAVREVIAVAEEA